jgi:ribonucrease Y
MKSNSLIFRFIISNNRGIMSSNHLLTFTMTFLVGMAFGGVLVWLVFRFKLGEFQSIAENLLQKAEFEAQSLQKQAELDIKESEIRKQKEFDVLWQEHQLKVKEDSRRLALKEDKVEEKSYSLEKKTQEVERQQKRIKKSQEELQQKQFATEDLQDELTKGLEEISKLSHEEAKRMLLSKVEQDSKLEAARKSKEIFKQAEEEANKNANRVISIAINRLAVRCVSETTVCTISLPSDDMKGRIIGKEGRNIRSLENATGVNFIIDDTPKAVVLSGFDPVRKAIAKKALEELILDGRIHPTNIEDVVAKSKESIHEDIKKYGEDACLTLGITQLHPELVSLLGQLKFRFSFGQNVLDHSIEVAFLLGMMAQELGLDVQMAKRIGLMHDMGKAVSHEIEGSHAVIGYDLALKYGETPEVANGIGCHHGEMEPITVEGSLCSAADALSASRPGARIEAVDQYIKRLEELEKIALSFPGVEKAFALQAGREVRVTVSPDLVDDARTFSLTRELAQEIERKLTYPGKIKVTVIREQRVVEYAV